MTCLKIVYAQVLNLACVNFGISFTKD